MYLHCSTKKQASTVMTSFLDAVSKYGLPDQVRSDSGEENVQVCMEVHDGTARL